MGYQSKTYSFSDEVVAAIEAKRAEGVSPERYLWSLIFRTQKISKRAQAAAERAASGVAQSETDDSGIGGDEPFCEHGNLLWSEDCDECAEESWALTERITKAIREGR